MSAAPTADLPDLHLPSTRRLAGFVVASLLLVALAGWRALDASAGAADDLRGDIPTGDAVRDELVDIAAARSTMLTELTAAEARLGQVLRDRDSLDDDQRRLAAQIEVATDSLRRIGVQAFITGGEIGELEFLATVGDANDFAWRRSLVRSHAGSASDAIERLVRLRASAGDDVLASIAEAGQLRSAITVLEVDIGMLDDREAAAFALLPLAEAWDRAAIAIETGSYGVAPADKWAKLRFCESSDDYTAVNPSGLYRGAYQFDIPTWRTVGGTGDPAQAPPQEQDARARELYARRGSQPWPECGRYLD